MKRVLLNALMLFVVSFILGCASTKSENTSRNVSAENTFNSELLNFSISFPSHVHRLPNFIQKQMQQADASMMSQNSPVLRQQIESNMNRVVNLFGVTLYPIGKPVNFNPALMAVAENISHRICWMSSKISDF